MNEKYSLDILKKFNEIYLKNKKIEEGDCILIQTLRGTKDTIVKKTTSGKLFVEASETKNFEDIVIVELKDLPKNYYIIPSFEFLVEKLIEREYTIILKKDSREICKGVKKNIFESITKIDLMKVLLNDE